MAVGAECDHDHQGYATGYQHALDYVFEYVEHLAMHATSQRIVADDAERLRSANFYGGQEAVLKQLLEWISEEDGDDDDQLTVGGQGVPAGGVAAGGGHGQAGGAGADAAVVEGEAAHDPVLGEVGDEGQPAVGFLGCAGGSLCGHDRRVGGA